MSGVVLLLDNIFLEKIGFFLEIEWFNYFLEILEILESIIEDLFFFYELMNIFKVDF